MSGFLAEVIPAQDLEQYQGVVLVPVNRHGENAIKSLNGNTIALQIQDPGKPKRTLDQNALIYALYADAAKQLSDCTAEEIKCYCKLHFGVPILRRDSAEFKQVYDELLRPMDYENKLKLMGLPINIPITSIMNKAQLSEYVDRIIQNFAEQNIVLKL